MIRLVNDTKVYVHAVIDNFCRRILAWCVVDKFEIASMVSPLRDAPRGAVIFQEMPKLVADTECRGPLRKIERPFKAVFRVLSSMSGIGRMGLSEVFVDGCSD